MNDLGQTEWLSPGFTWLIVTIAAVWFILMVRAEWRRAGRRVDDANAACCEHAGRQYRYATYQVCSDCGTRTDLP